MTFKQFLAEAINYPSRKQVVNYLNANYKIIDKDMGGVYVVLDPKTEFEFEVEARGRDLRVTPLAYGNYAKVSDEHSRAADMLYRELTNEAMSGEYDETY